jgi:hypothetical protein
MARSYKPIRRLTKNGGEPSLTIPRKIARKYLLKVGSSVRILERKNGFDVQTDKFKGQQLKLPLKNKIPKKFNNDSKKRKFVKGNPKRTAGSRHKPGGRIVTGHKDKPKQSVQQIERNNTKAGTKEKREIPKLRKKNRTRNIPFFPSAADIMELDGE